MAKWLKYKKLNSYVLQQFRTVQVLLMENQNEMQIEYQIPQIEFELEFQPLENQSMVMGQSQLIFPKVDLVIDKNGIKQLSNPENTLTKFKIIPSNMTQKQIIGKGAAGVVRRALYIFDGVETVVAIKEITAAQKDKRDQLLNDLRTFLTGPQSEYLVTFYGCYYHAGFVKQVIQYMNLGSLKNITNLVAKQLLIIDEQHLAQIVNRILLGLNYIHRVKHQIHRDVKPQNILINDKGEIKITDFGTAKFIENTLGLAGTFTGTTIYMSPQRIGFGNKYNYKCDVWSLGLIVYELTTGKQLPYKNNKSLSMMGLMQKIIGQNPPDLQGTDRSDQLKNFMSLCLQKNPESRSSVQQLLKHSWIQKHAGKADMQGFMGRVRQLLQSS